MTFFFQNSFFTQAQYIVFFFQTPICVVSAVQRSPEWSQSGENYTRNEWALLGHEESTNGDEASTPRVDNQFDSFTENEKELLNLFDEPEDNNKHILTINNNSVSYVAESPNVSIQIIYNVSYITYI